VEADHGVEAKRLRSFARAVDYILADQEFLRESLHLAVHDFIEHQRQHLEKGGTALVSGCREGLALRWEPETEEIRQ